MSEKQMTVKGVLVKCQKCNYVWDYTGAKKADQEPPVYVTCTRCYYKVPLKETRKK